MQGGLFRLWGVLGWLRTFPGVARQKVPDEALHNLGRPGTLIQAY
jgi:hypothetical protein